MAIGTACTGSAASPDGLDGFRSGIFHVICRCNYVTRTFFSVTSTLQLGVTNLSPTSSKSDQYWMGVRDALRMVDSFTKWARRNESRAKSLDDFIHDGLVAAAKRCESCLKDDLGLTFVEDKEPLGETRSAEQIPSGYEMKSSSREDADFEEPSDSAFEVTPDDLTPGTSEVPIESESDTDTIGIDTVGRLEEEEMDDLSIDGLPREFTSDFELVEPTDLTVEQSDTTQMRDVTHEPEPETRKVEPSHTEHKASFTWADYEKAVTPDVDDSEIAEEDEDAELPPPIELESFEPPLFSDGPAPESSSVPVDKPESETIEVPEPPSFSMDEFEHGPIDEDDDIESADEPEPITKPPPPSPPPDSDEDEDERRRRARRLFFGD
jgi:hypothetical protein